jgi:hypothetical protein
MDTGFPGGGFGMAVIGFIAIIAVIIVGSMIFGAAKGLSEWSNNNAQPVLRVPAKIVARRTNLSVSSATSGHHHHDDLHHSHGSTSTSTSTQYYATFELENGERMEFQLSDHEAGLLLEGDQGELTYQGTRYHGFARRLPDGTFARPTSDDSPAVLKPEAISAPLSGAVCVRCEKPLVVGSNQCPACDWTQPG